MTGLSELSADGRHLPGSGVFGARFEIGASVSRVAVRVMPTDASLKIARLTRRVLAGAG